MSEPGNSDPAETPQESRLNRFARNTRAITIVWITSAILNVVFLASIVVLGVGNSNNAAELHRQSVALRTANVSQCQQNNQNRAQDIVIWNLVEKPTSERNAATEKKFALLKQLVGVKDAPRNCVKVYTP
jgi:hypothetical protein